MTPEWGRRALDIPPETQFLLLEVEEGGPYAIALPLIDNQTFRGTLRGPRRCSAADDEMVLRIESGDANVVGQNWANALYLAADSDPFALVERAVAAAAAMSGGAKPLREKQLPGLLDVFGWCTWDAFYSRVSARAGLHEGLRSLIAGGAAPGFLIIDDGWQCTDGGMQTSGRKGCVASARDFTRRLTSIKANSKFSSPLAGPEEYYSQLGKVVDSLKQLYGLRYIYCWHGLSCYWSGVSPYEEDVANYNARLVFSEPTPGLVEIEPSMAWNPSVISGVGVVDNVRDIYSDMHAYLAAAGINGVKVDCQAGVGLAGSTEGGGPQAALHLNGALEDSVAAHFPGNHCINCMCHSTENLYRMRDTAVVRVSDDFYPRNPASSYPHIAACAYNGFFLSAIMHPDWDMFQSKHPAATAHAAARAVSGAAVYVSDYPGQHDFDLLKSLVLPGGGVLRAALPGRPTADCLFTDVLRDNKSVLKVWNANACNAVVGAFNLQGSSWDRTRRQYRIHNSKPPTLKTEVLPSPCPVLPALTNAHYQFAC
ncbi:raffinose synthase [Coccomyxa subellipsoidea C-169]|uniref:galactinol--sucrose galactosyltransferase n=1 Tax=Coccomyxa subellipsoidea (strain C-169) TaxID=574566 RepID=I0Z8Z5_COCSC|nr:raffinose synthase [Coccomyxa subellipsoidea C-169]EIE27114.1 raffinose synthase [Coccomyxa subellipsoidea C-169]|eukprot:XP_005651658.1 raffinose synthase [Coccomyxa subellipsoidea C-169]